MSPVGNTLRVRARRFPALLSCTTVNWFHEWPQEALQSVSLQFIKELRGIEVRHTKKRSTNIAHTVGLLCWAI